MHLMARPETVAALLFLSPLVSWRPEGLGSQPGPWKVAAVKGEGSGQKEGSPGPQKRWKGRCAGRDVRAFSVTLSHVRHLQKESKFRSS